MYHSYQTKKKLFFENKIFLIIFFSKAYLREKSKSRSHCDHSAIHIFHVFLSFFWEKKGGMHGYGMYQRIFCESIFFFTNFQILAFFSQKFVQKKIMKKKCWKNIKILVHAIGIVMINIHGKIQSSAMNTFWDMVVNVWKKGVFRRKFKWLVVFVQMALQKWL